MKYMLLTYLDEKKWESLTPEQQKAQMDLCAPHVEKLLGSGVFLGGAPLQSTSMATTVRIRGGKHLVTDGPFAETREQLGGYTLIEAKDLDEAMRIASGFLVDGGLLDVAIEVRPVVEIALPTH